VRGPALGWAGQAKVGVKLTTTSRSPRLGVQRHQIHNWRGDPAPREEEVASFPEVNWTGHGPTHPECQKA